MAITLRGIGSPSPGSTTCVTDWVAGAVGDAIIALLGNKPFGSTPVGPDGTWSQLSTGTSGSVASAASTGSVRATCLLKTATAAGTGTATHTDTGANVTNGKAARYGFDSGLFTAVGVTLADTDESLVTVSATGTVAAGSIAAGDAISIAVVIKDDAPVHTSQSLTVAGCTLSAISWQSKTTTLTGDDLGMYIGTCTVTAGSSTGSVTYGATSGTAGASATAVSVVRVREIVPPNAPTGFIASDDQSTGVNTSWTAPASGTTPDDYTVYRQIVPSINGTFDTDISGWTPGQAGTVAWEAADQAIRMTYSGGSPEAASPAFAATPGARYKVVCDIKRVAGVDRAVRSKINYYDSAGALITAQAFAIVTSSASYQTMGGTWSTPAPANAVTAKAIANSFQAAAGDAFVVDNMVVTEQATFTGIATTSYSDTTAIAGTTYTYWALGTSQGFEGAASNTDPGLRTTGSSRPPPIRMVTRPARIRAAFY